jgi:hypothetical protein
MAHPSVFRLHRTPEHPPSSDLPVSLFSIGEFAMKYLYLLSIFVLLLFSSPSLLAQDTSCGIAWGAVLCLSDGVHGAFSPHIATQGETLHVTWEGGNYRLPYRRSIDGGLSWEPTRELINDTSIASASYPWLVANSEKVYFFFSTVTQFGNSPVCIMESSDRGSSWAPYESLNTERATQIRHVSLRGDTIVVQYPRPSPLSTYRFFVTTNGGGAWDSSIVVAQGPIDIGGGALHNVWGQVFVGHGQEVVYKRSIDLGRSWQDSVVLSALDDEWSHDAKIAVSTDFPPRIYTTWRETKYGCLTLVGCSIVMRISGDGGLTWGDELPMTATPAGYNWDWGQQIASRGENVAAVWINDQTGHIDSRYSVNQGDSWTDVCDMTPGGSATTPSCALSQTALHVFWEDRRSGEWSIWYRRGVILSSSVEDPGSTPRAIKLFQNYPNPFNGVTRIEYTIDEGRAPSWVSLKIFDLLGQEMATLVDEPRPSGLHSVTWDARDLSTGIYFSRLSVFGDVVRSKTSTRTMMLLK